MVFGEDEGMFFGYWVFVVDGVGGGVFCDWLVLFGGCVENVVVLFLCKWVVLVFVDFVKVVE